VALGISRLGVIGLSGGGPHGLACAALLEDLVPAVVSLAAAAPYDALGLDYFAGMGDLNVEDVKSLLRDPKAARKKSGSDRLELLAAGPAQMLEQLDTILPTVDKRYLSAARAPWRSSGSRSISVAASSRSATRRRFSPGRPHVSKPFVGSAAAWISFFLIARRKVSVSRLIFVSNPPHMCADV
jgi:pimeloyl-ACP methyl ester carboxylesterase